MTTRTRSACFTFSDREMPVRFGRYHLLARLCADPIGEEFLAAWGVEEGVDQLRAVRCIYPRVAQEAEFVSLFSEEARSLSRLSSANVVRVMEVGTEGRIPFVAREHVEGLDLGRLMQLAEKRTALWPWEIAAHVAAEVLRGLDYVHRREDLYGRPMGMRHGDVRPRNVLVSFNGEVKLANFGSTLRFIADERTNAELDELRARYLPPEGIDEVEPTVAADLWGAAMIFLVLLGGHPPSRRTSEHDRPWAPPEMAFRVESMPEIVDTFLGRALNPDPTFRFQTAEEMRGALLSIMSDHVEGHPPDELARWMRELGDDDRRAESELVRRLLGKEAAIDLEAADGAGPLGPGKVLDSRYHLLRKLGEGGMGIVYEAEHMGLGRKVAVKVLHDRVLDDANTVERFRREAQIIGNLGHPNIVGALDFGVSPEGHHYLAMDLLEGVSLATRIEQRSLSAKEIARIMAQVCDGLQAAHAAHVIHRDLKPDNIYLTPTGARILDFGIAKSTGLDAEAEALTRTGHICGTVDYIAPEQIRGISQDPRSDIYAAGVIIYEALTGETPFHGRTVGETLHKAMNDKLVPPRKRTGDKTIPEALEAVCLRALSRKAEKRFDSAERMAGALRALLPPDGETGPIARVQARRKALLPVVAAAAVLSIVGVGAWLALRPGGEPQGEAVWQSDAGASKVEEPVGARVPVVVLEARGAASTDGGATAAKGEAMAVDEEAAKTEALERSEKKTEEGEAALARMDLDAAERAFKEAVKQDSRNSRAWYGLGVVSFQRGEYNLAVERVERSLRYAPGNKQRRVFLGKVFIAAGRKTDAIAQWKRVLATDPGNPAVQKLIDKAEGP